MNIAFECLFGSHLYGTATENSDTDYLGVFIPSREEISEDDKSRLDKFIFTQHYKACQPDFWS